MWKDGEVGEGGEGGCVFDAEGGYLCWWVSVLGFSVLMVMLMLRLLEFLRIRKVPMDSHEPLADDGADEKVDGPRIVNEDVIATLKRLNMKDRDMFEKVCGSRSHFCGREISSFGILEYQSIRQLGSLVQRASSELYFPVQRCGYS